MGRARLVRRAGNGSRGERLGAGLCLGGIVPPSGDGEGTPRRSAFSLARQGGAGAGTLVLRLREGSREGQRGGRGAIFSRIE